MDDFFDGDRLATPRKARPATRLRRAALRQRMDANDGLVTAGELTMLGFSRREISGMVDRGELVRTRRGLYRGRGVRWDHRTELRAALIEQGKDARLVLISSLHWQGLLHRPADLPQVGLPGDGDVQTLSTRVVHRTPYANANVKRVIHAGLPCSAPVDALPHLAGHVRGDHAIRRALRRAVREAVRRDARLARRLDELVRPARPAPASRPADSDAPARLVRRIPGAQELRDALSALPSGTVIKSDLEEDFTRFCEIWGLPRFLMNHVIAGVERDAVRVAEQLIVELDTRGYHGNLITMESDRRRRRRATVAGWRHLEITGHDLRDEPARVAADLAALFAIPGWVAPANAATEWAAVLASAVGIWLPKH